MRAAICWGMAGLVWAAAPGRAEACGGFFSAWVEQPSEPAAAVEQSGESVIFVMGGDLAEVHVQVSYDPGTNADEFAWMIPLAAVPEFSVGSQPLFDQVRAATVPRFGLGTVTQECLPEPTGGATGAGGRAPRRSGATEERTPGTPSRT